MTTPLTMKPAARRAVMEILLAMTWADGVAEETEREALRGAALALGLPELARSLRDEAFVYSREGAPLESQLRLLDDRERKLAYGAAAWMALSDGIRQPMESLLLAQLRQRLAIDPEEARWLEGLARWVRAEVEPLPWHRELDRLLRTSAQRIVQIERLKEERILRLAAEEAAREAAA
jgi:tellurite resistance protein